MSKLLTLKHWQLFILLIGIPLILLGAIFFSILLSGETIIASYLLPLILILFAIVFYSWFYSLGTNLCQKLTQQVSKGLIRFKIAVFTSLLYICIISLFMLLDVFDISPIKKGSGLFALIIPFHLLTMVGTFYCLYFISKALKTVESGKLVTFSDFIGEFLLLWFFPVGIWIIQPRINKIFDHSFKNNI